MNIYKKWAKIFVSWFRVSKKKTLTPIKLEEYYSDASIVFRFEDPTIPGCIDYWRINRKDNSNAFFICIINCEKMRQDLAGVYSPGRGDRLHTWERGIAAAISTQLEEQKGIDATHYWITGWIVERSGVDSRGRSYRGPGVDDVAVIACHLQIYGGEFWSGDRYAHRIIREIILRLATKMESALNPWETIVREIDWVTWLTVYAQKIISKRHILQPHKPEREAVSKRFRLFN